ncbi:hypothetical protein F5B20DRAFT_434030 [Whalleya microplaca]|nr:hypothetical protein F5B20DRAFT_434030 [Whalleya microplaca]
MSGLRQGGLGDLLCRLLGLACMAVSEGYEQNQPMIIMHLRRRSLPRDGEANQRTRPDGRADRGRIGYGAGGDSRVRLVEIGNVLMCECGCIETESELLG